MLECVACRLPEVSGVMHNVERAACRLWGVLLDERMTLVLVLVLVLVHTIGVEEGIFLRLENDIFFLSIFLLLTFIPF